MMTIKHVDTNNQERVTEVVSVAVNNGELIGYGETADTVIVRHSTGHVYVMNGQGKTVAVYNLNK